MEEGQTTQQPPVEGQTWTETPIPLGGPSGPGLAKAPNQPGAPATPQGEKLPNLFDMVPSYGEAGHTSLETLSKYDEPVPFDANMRAMNYIRGANQSLLAVGLKSIGMSAANLSLGVVDGLAYTLDFQSHIANLNKVEDDYSNWLSNYVDTIRPNPEDYIFQKEPGQIRPLDPAFWGTMASDVAYSAGIMAPGVLMAALSRGIINPIAGSSAAAGAVGSTVLAGMVQRMGESLMEAKEISTRVYNDAIALGYSEDQARAMQGKAGSTTYNNNMKLGLVDALQLGAIFGAAKNLVGLRGNGFNRFLKKNRLTYPFEIISEGAEEGIQYGISEKSYEDVFRGTYMPEKTVLGKSLESLGDPDMQRAMISGALGGAVFSAVGPQLKKLSQSKEYKAFLRENEAALSKLPTNGEIEHIKDSKFLDLVTRHANTGQLEKVQDKLSLFANIKPEQLQAEGTNPETFYAEVGRRQQQVAELGKIYNNVFGRTKVDRVIKERLFENYAVKHNNNYRIAQATAAIEKLVDEEVETGNFTPEDAQKYVKRLKVEYLKDLKNVNTSYQVDARDQLLKEVTADADFALDVADSPVEKRFLSDIELRDKVDELVGYEHERRFRDLELVDLEKPAFQKELVERINKIKESEKAVKAESIKENAKVERKIKAAETKAADIAEGEAAKSTKKSGIRSPKERKAQEDRIIKTLAEFNGDVNQLSTEDREFYDKSKDVIDKKLEAYVASQKEAEASEAGKKAGAPKAGSLVAAVIDKITTQADVQQVVKETGEVLKKYLPERVGKYTITSEGTFSNGGNWRVGYIKSEERTNVTTGEKYEDVNTQHAVLDAEILTSGDEQAIVTHIKERLDAAGIKEDSGSGPAGSGTGGKNGGASETKGTPAQQETTRRIKADQELVNSKPEKKGEKYIIGGEEHERVSNVIPEFFEGKTGYGDLALDVGSRVDEMLKDIFDNTTKKKYKKLSKEEVAHVTKQLKEFKDKEEAKGAQFLTSVVVFDPDLKIAGEVDLLAVYPDGTYAIYDFKSSKDFTEFEKKSKKRYTYQLSAYNNLLYRRYGKDAAKLELIPVVADYESDGVVTVLDKVANIPLEYDAGVEKYVPKEDVEDADLTFLESEREAGLKAFEQSALAKQMKFDDFASFLKSKSRPEILDRLEAKEVIKKDCS